MPRGVLAQYLRSQRTSLFTSREKGNHYYIQTSHDDLFFPITIGTLRSNDADGKENVKKQ